MRIIMEQGIALYRILSQSESLVLHCFVRSIVRPVFACLKNCSGYG